MRVVTVETGREVARAELLVDGTVRYTGGDSARSAVENYSREHGTTPAEALAALTRSGWSNGYLMIDLDES
jgi:hypothetical protein